MAGRLVVDRVDEEEQKPNRYLLLRQKYYLLLLSFDSLCQGLAVTLTIIQ